MIVLLGAGAAHAQMPPLRSYVGSGPTSAERPAAELPADEPEVRLTLPEAVYLGLRRNPAVRGAYLERVLDQFNLHVAESRFSPVGSIVGSVGVDRTGSTRTGAVGIAPTVQMLTPLGTTIQFGWDMRQRGSRQPDSGTIAGISALNASLVQPLLRGAGVDAATAPLRQACLQERYAQLRLKAVVSETVTDILRAYHQFIQTRQQIVLARAALRRAHELEATSWALIRAGRMAEADLVQAQTTVDVVAARRGLRLAGWHRRGGVVDLSLF
ncbi:TolC family protein [Azospirillum sp. INR13]|uniref:TolC family protein n=1 Tax=Azospirillum sp. INR13 TaxID=2596919 RepID=UPI0018922772|nr:TolC family protein [Azospirillum sp. INR13]MBF5094977.1 TolC family protein [Azospirillum sp. INR13]